MFRGGMRFSVPLSLVLGGLAVACTSSTQSGTVPGVDGGPDGGVVVPPGPEGGAPVTDASPGNGDENPVETTCTAGPFVGFTADVTELHTNNTQLPVQGIQVGFTTCVGFHVATDANGHATSQMTKGLAYSPTYAGGDILGAVGAEVPGNADVHVTPLLIAQDDTAAVPGYDSTAPTIAIHFVADPGAMGACQQIDGVSLQVTGHTEAVVNYMTTSWPTNPSPSSGTVSAGEYAFIVGIKNASVVQVTGTKAGCHVAFVTSSQTGNFALLNGAITMGVATVTN
jgi:hypothetical protein